MVDWTILSPTFLRAVVEWAVTVVIVLAAGSGHSTKDPKAGVKNAAGRELLIIHPKRTRGGSDQRVHRNPATLVTLVVPVFGVRSISRSTTPEGETGYARHSA
jgi:hypothetical protein